MTDQPDDPGGPEEPASADAPTPDAAVAARPDAEAAEDVAGAPPAAEGAAEGAAGGAAGAVPSSARAAGWVGAGILLSRVAGFVREAVFAFYFGSSSTVDAWRAALKTPNVIQNLLGEGTLSASFIPVYAELLEEGREEEAGHFAGAVLGILSAVAGAAALVGVLVAPLLVALILPSWDEPQQRLAVTLTRILFPMTAVLAVSAWALGILNSHRKFFLSYVAPVGWNVVQIGVLVTFGTALGWQAAGRETDLVVALAWGALAGGVVQFAVQLPWVVPLLKHFRLSLGRRVTGVREAIRNFLPVVAARGVINLSSLLDVFLAGFLAYGALSLLGYVQTLYLLPISLFGMSIAASELPELSRQRQEAEEVLRGRVRSSLRRVAFLLIPSTLAYVVAGDLFVAAVYERGRFGTVDTLAAYAVLGAYALGLLASSSSRVLSSAYYALRDTRTPAVVAVARVAASAAVGAALMFPLDRLQVTAEGSTLRLGAAGLALGSVAGAWMEYALLRRRLRARIGPHGPGAAALAKMLGAGVAAAAVGLGAKWLLHSTFPDRPGLLATWLGPDSFLLEPAAALGTALAFGVTYLAVAAALGVGAPIRRLLRRG